MKIKGFFKVDKILIAAALNGTQYRNEDGVIKSIDTSRVLIVFGASDDLMEFRGSINDEIGCYDGGEVFISKDGLFEPCECGCQYSISAKNLYHKIEAAWDIDGYSWIYRTELPHATFDIMEDDKKYCRGIVIDIEDIKRK